jgi:hypothetical protein
MWKTGSGNNGTISSINLAIAAKVWLAGSSHNINMLLLLQKWIGDGSSLERLANASACEGKSLQSVVAVTEGKVWIKGGGGVYVCESHVCRRMHQQSGRNAKS